MLPSAQQIAQSGTRKVPAHPLRRKLASNCKLNCNVCNSCVNVFELSFIRVCSFRIDSATQAASLVALPAQPSASSLARAGIATSQLLQQPQCFAPQSLSEVVPSLVAAAPASSSRCTNAACSRLRQQPENQTQAGTLARMPAAPKQRTRCILPLRPACIAEATMQDWGGRQSTGSAHLALQHSGLACAMRTQT